MAAPLNEGKWATAEPGKPANLPPKRMKPRVGGKQRTGRCRRPWLATTPPIPTCEHERPEVANRSHRKSKSRAAAEVAHEARLGHPSGPVLVVGRTSELVADAVTHLATLLSRETPCIVVRRYGRDLHSSAWPMLRHCLLRRPLADSMSPIV